MQVEWATIPVPGNPRKSWPFKTMKVGGQCCTLTFDNQLDARLAQSMCHSYAQVSGKSFRTRRIGRFKLRVWRLE
jgi:hypothetical protein